MSGHPGLAHVLAIAGEQALLSELGKPAPVLGSLLRRMLDANFPLPFLHSELDEDRSLVLVRLSAVQYLVANGAGSFLLSHTKQVKLAQVHDVFFRDGRGHLLTEDAELNGDLLQLDRLPRQGWNPASTWVVRLPASAKGRVVHTQLPKRFDVPGPVAFGPSRVCSQLVLHGCDVPEVPMWAGRTLWCASDLECHCVKSCPGALMLTVPAQSGALASANRVCWSPGVPDCVCVFGFDEMMGCAVLGVLRYSGGRWRPQCKDTLLMWQEPHFAVQHSAAHEIELRGLLSGRSARLSDLCADF